MKTDQFSSMDDVIFEKRNKLYGAYELRANYHRRLIKSFAVVSVLFVSVFLISRISRKIVPPLHVERRNDTLIFDSGFTEIQIQKQTYSGTTTQPPEQSQVEQAYVPVNDTTPLTDNVDTSANSTPSDPNPFANNTGTQGESGDSAHTNNHPDTPKVRNLASVDKVPEFPGGIERFYKYIISRVQYTSIAKEAGAKGRMYVRFVVDEEGLVTDVKVMRRFGYGMDEQVERVLVESPKWNPGSVRNSPVKTEMVLPVNFDLK